MVIQRVTTSSALRAISLGLFLPMVVASRVDAQVPSPTGSPPGATSPVQHERVLACRSWPVRLATSPDASIATLCPDSLELAPVHDLTDLLSTRIPGVHVQETSGITGTAARIWIRGPGSTLLDNEPLVVVDGVRMFSTPITTAVLGAQRPSRLDDIRIEDIETLEVLRGPATSAMYGTGAAGGVIRITTKRGFVGAPRWTAFAEAGPALEVTRFPANYGLPGTITASGLPTLSCDIDSRVRGLCAPDGMPLASFNPLEQASPFRQGLRQAYGASVSGGKGWLRYHGGTGYVQERGVYETSDLGRRHARLNLDVFPLSELRVGITSGYLSRNAHFPKTDGSSYNVLGGGLLGNPVDDPVSRGYWYSPPDSAYRRTTREETSRLDLGFSAEWHPLAWLAISAGAGIDRTTARELQRLPNDWSAWRETRTTTGLGLEKATAAVSAKATYSLGGDFEASSRLGVDHDETKFKRDYRHASDPELQGWGFQKREFETRGLYIDQRVTWRERVHAHATLRQDDFPEARGDVKKPLYPSAGVSWLVRQAPADRASLGALRLHLAYGEAGGTPMSPDFPLIVRPLFPMPGYVEEELKNERTKELEAGVSTSLLDERVQLTATYYDRKTIDGLFIDEAMLGLTNLLNRVDVDNSGFETGITVAAVRSHTIDIQLELGGSFNTNRVRSIPRSIYVGSIGGFQRHQEGQPLAGFWRRRVLSYEDRNGDGTISRVNCPGQPQVADGPACEIEISGEEYAGPSFPGREIFFAPRLSVNGLVEITALLDHRGGFMQYNHTESTRCMARVCREIQDDSAPLRDQARAVGRLMGAHDYYEDASFIKLRELAVSVAAPSGWATRIGASSARITLAGRNLATWTDYSGLDPEISASGPLGLVQGEAYGQPPVRYVTARLTVGW